MYLRTREKLYHLATRNILPSYTTVPIVNDTWKLGCVYCVVDWVGPAPKNVALNMHRRQKLTNISAIRNLKLRKLGWALSGLSVLPIAPPPTEGKKTYTLYTEIKCKVYAAMRNIYSVSIDWRLATIYTSYHSTAMVLSALITIKFSSVLPVR